MKHVLLSTHSIQSALLLLQLLASPFGGGWSLNAKATGMSCLLKMGGSSSSGCWLRNGSLQEGWLRSDSRDRSLLACTDSSNKAIAKQAVFIARLEGVPSCCKLGYR
jgi:hypothetical protein